MGEGRVFGGFGADIYLGIVGITVEVQVDNVADMGIKGDVTKGEEVADEEEGSED